MTNSISNKQVLKKPSRQFFMSLRDIFFWIRSAKADSALTNLHQRYEMREAFDLLYEETFDPYGSTLPYYRYQNLKYDTLLSLLPAQHYASALDIGCGLGTFTRKLAEQVDRVVGVDLSQVAVEQARSLSTEYAANVSFEQADVLDLRKTIHAQFELVALADVLYYVSPLSDEVLKSVAQQVESLLQPNGILLLVHHFFFGYDANSKVTRRIHDAFRWTRSLTLLSEHRRPFYLVSLLQKSGLY